MGERRHVPVGGQIGTSDPPGFLGVATEERPTQKLNWPADLPVRVVQWPLSKKKLKALTKLVEEELAKGHIV